MRKQKKKTLVKPIPKKEKGVCLYGEANGNCIHKCG